LDAIGRSNLIDSPGLIQNQHQLVLGLVSGQARTPAEISNIAVKTTPAGVPLHIGDIASVLPSVKPVYTTVTANQKPAVLLNIYRQPDSNTVLVAAEVHREIEQIRRSLPRQVELRPFYDQSEIVNDSIKGVRDAILIGLVLASLILVAFLRDWGTSLVAGLVIPATIAVTFIALRVLGESFNLMTLGGLAAAVGLVIDDAIVVVENIVMHRDTGQSRAEAVRSAIREIRAPLIGSTVTPIVVFLPLISITGVTGTFFRALAVTVGMALLTSLALALTWTPTLSHYLIRRHGAGHRGVPRLAKLRARLHHDRPSLPVRTFQPSRHRRLLSLPEGLGSGSVARFDEGGFIIDYIMPAGSSLDETNRVCPPSNKFCAQCPKSREPRGAGAATGPCDCDRGKYG
jgi:multidrug efflux pump subunit AcrB